MDGQIPGPAKVLRAPSLKRGKPEERITDRVSCILRKSKLLLLGVMTCMCNCERPCYFRDATFSLWLFNL